MKIRIMHNKIKVQSDYSPELSFKAKKFGGKWDSNDHSWNFNAINYDKVKELYFDIFGEFDRLTLTI